MKETFWVCSVCSPARCYLKSIGLATPTECVMSLNGIPRWESEQQASKSVEAQNSTSTNKQMAAISAAEKWVINRDIPPTGFDSFMAGVEWQKQHH